MNHPRDIRIGDRTLAEVLADHAAWRRGEGGARADLTDADLARADLTGTNLTDANLTDANLTGAYLARADLTDADLIDANLTDANLTDAKLTDANLTGATGNMREVKSAHTDKWALAWTMAPDGTAWLQIGCQRHPVEMWRKSDPRWIAAMDPAATDWWAKHRGLVLMLVDASPATPWGAGPSTPTDGG